MPEVLSPANDLRNNVKQSIDPDAYKLYLSDLKKDGPKYIATCPIHNDSHPSLVVEFKRDAWVWFCYPCNKGGDLFTLVREKFGISFPEALERIASDLGIEKTSSRFTYQAAAAQESLQRNVVALAGLADRGISAESAKRAGLGLVEHPGIGSAITIPYDSTVVKLRAVTPKNKGDKFRHLHNAPSAHLLYGIDQLKDEIFDTVAEVHITESELDSLTMRQAGFTTLSVSSATTCINKDGSLKILAEHMEQLDRAERIFLWFDQDSAGQKCADAFEKVLPSYKTFRITWTFRGKESGDPKDTGELYQQAPENFRETIRSLRDAAVNRPPAWRKLFKSKSEMDSQPMKFLISGFMPEGVTFFGALSGSGKTWLCLSMAKALTTGQKFLGNFPVPEPVNVLYLIPESGERSFRQRMELMGISDQRFLCRTMTQGQIKLSDPDLLLAVRALEPVVFLDTAIRFSEAEDENAASQSARSMANAAFALLGAGARGVVGVHHSPKNAATKESTLENTLRGSGDLGAMSDAVYVLKVEDPAKLQVKIHNVKARDFEPVAPFTIVGRPFINENRDFAVLAKIDEPEFQRREREKQERFITAVTENPTATFDELEKILDENRRSIQRLASETGWKKPRHDIWKNETQAVN